MESAVRATAVIRATVTAMVDTDAPEVEEVLESLQETMPLDARLPLDHTAQRTEAMASARTSQATQLGMPEEELDLHTLDMVILKTSD